MYNGLDSIWIQCPLTAANRVVSESKLKMDWTVVRTELLQKEDPYAVLNVGDKGMSDSLVPQRLIDKARVISVANPVIWLTLVEKKNRNALFARKRDGNLK